MKSTGFSYRLPFYQRCKAVLASNNRFERSRVYLREAKEVFNDLDKSASIGVDATPRCSTSSLGPMKRFRVGLVLIIACGAAFLVADTQFDAGTWPLPAPKLSIRI